MFIDRIILFPYYLTLLLRNSYYDKGGKRVISYEIPIISIGNVTVGGTGKTPHTEMLIREFSKEKRIAVISRGYKRKTRGLREVQISDNYRDVGDEPLQIKRKFPDIKVIVDTSRKRAIDSLISLPDGEKPELILLDDGFQYRKIVPSLSILLVDYSKPIFQDSLLPIGYLRDLPSQIKRADIVIVTKVPDIFEPIDRFIWRDNLHLKENQALFFSKICYDFPVPLFPEECDKRYLYSKSAILFSGIANDSHLRNNLIGQYKLVSILKFSDHHNFSSSDIDNIEYLSHRYPTAVIFTTEKDAQRIFSHKSLTPNIRSRLFFIPIKPQIIPEITPGQRVIEEELGEIGESQFSIIIKKKVD